MEKQINYVYLTTNLINNKQYVGEHHTNNINDDYLGSGTYLLRSIKKHDKSNFKKEILEYFNNKQEAIDNQEKYIIQYNTLTPNGYNISPKGGHHCKDSISEETRKKISDTKKGYKLSEKIKQKINFVYKPKDGTQFKNYNSTFKKIKHMNNK